MAVSPRIHWVNLSFLAVLEVLPRRSEEVETHHLAMGLHPRSDGTECAAVAGRNARDEICGLRIYREKWKPILTMVCISLTTICDRTGTGADSRNGSYSGAHSRKKAPIRASARHLSGCPITNLIPELESSSAERYSKSIFLAVGAGGEMARSPLTVKACLKLPTQILRVSQMLATRTLCVLHQNGVRCLL